MNDEQIVAIAAQIRTAKAAMADAVFKLDRLADALPVTSGAAARIGRFRAVCVRANEAIAKAEEQFG
jgi:hypothetical protein